MREGEQRPLGLRDRQGRVDFALHREPLALAGLNIAAGTALP